MKKHLGRPNYIDILEPQRKKIISLITHSSEYIREELLKDGVDVAKDSISKYKLWLLKHDEEAKTGLKAYFLNSEIQLTSYQLELETLKERLSEQMNTGEGLTLNLEKYLSIVDRQIHDISLNMRRVGEWISKVESTSVNVSVDMDKFMALYQTHFVNDHVEKDGQVVCVKPELINLFKRRAK